MCIWLPVYQFKYIQSKCFAAAKVCFIILFHIICQNVKEQLQYNTTVTEVKRMSVKTDNGAETRGLRQQHSLLL